jgi:O-antigen ligase
MRQNNRAAVCAVSRNDIPRKNDILPYPTVFGVLLALATLKGAAIESGYWVGNIALYIVFLAGAAGYTSCLVRKTRFAAWQSTFILHAWLVLIAVYTFALVYGRYIDGLYTYTELFLVLCLFAYASCAHWTRASAYRFTVVYTATLFAAWGMLSVIQHDMEAILPANANQVAIVSFMGIVGCVIGYSLKKNVMSRVCFVAIMLLWLRLLQLSQCRGTWLATACFVAVYLAYPFFPSRKIFHVFCFLGITVIILYFVQINTEVWSFKSDIEQNLADINVQTAENKNIRTRSDTWIPIVHALESYPFTGMGLGFSRRNLPGVTDDLSAHSMYMQIGLQAGLPGIAAFALVIFAIGYGLVRSTEDRVFGRIGYPLLVAIAINDCFETSLLENNLAVAASMWAMLALCLYLHNVNPKRIGGKNIIQNAVALKK